MSVIVFKGFIAAGFAEPFSSADPPAFLNGFDPSCTISMWSGQSLLMTVVLVLAIGSEVYAGAQMKRARGFCNKAASVKALLAVCACVACCIELLSRVELSLGWAFYTVFELVGVAAVGVVVEAEAMTWAKLGGLVAVLSGSALFEVRAHGREGRRPARAGEVCQVTLNLVALAGAVLLVTAPLYFRRSASVPGDARSEDSTESSTSTVSAGRRFRWVRPLCLYGCLTLAAVGEVVLAVCMKEAAGFGNRRFSAASFLVASAVTCLTILALKHSSLIIGWMLYTAFEYIGVQLVAVLYYADEMDVPWIAASLFTLLGVLLLIIEEERDPDEPLCSCRCRYVQDEQLRQQRWMQEQQQLQQQLQQHLQQQQVQQRPQQNPQQDQQQH